MLGTNSVNAGLKTLRAKHFAIDNRHDADMAFHNRKSGFEQGIQTLRANDTNELDHATGT